MLDSRFDLFKESSEASIQLVQDRLGSVESSDEFLRASEELPDVLYKGIAGDLVQAEVWRAVHSIRELRHLDVIYSQAATKVLVDASRAFVPAPVSDERLEGAYYLVCELLGATTLAALERGGHEGEILIQEFVVMIGHYVASLLDEGVGLPPFS